MADCPIAGHTNSYHTYGLEEALAGIAEAGFRHVELSAVPGWTEHVDVDGDPAPVRRALERAGLQAVSLSAHSDLTTAAGVAHAKRAMRFAAELGVGIVNTAIGGHASADEDERAFLAAVEELADAARAAGVTLALEIHGSIMASGRQSAPFLARIGRPEIRINYDTANVTYYSGEKAEEDIAYALPYLAHVHLKDHVGGQGSWNFPALGEGEVDFPRVFAVLRQAGYRGPLSVEIEFRGEPWPALAEVNRAMRVSYAYLRRHGW